MPGIGRSHLRLVDVRRVFQLIGEIRDLEGEALLQQQRVIDGIGELLGIWIGFYTQFENFTATEDVRAGNPLITGDFGDTKVTRWVQHWAENHKLRDDPLIDASVRINRRIVAGSRAELTDLKAYWKSEIYRSFHDATGRHGGDALVCFFRKRNPSRATGIALHRQPEDRAFTQRERDILRLFTIELYRLYRDGRLAPNDDQPHLSPRLRQVFKELLTGKDARQIADELGVSRRTIDDYLLNIYKKFDVRHRAELMARFIDQGKGGRANRSFPWNAPEQKDHPKSRSTRTGGPAGNGGNSSSPKRIR